IRGAVYNVSTDATKNREFGFPLAIRNGWYEYSPGEIGMRLGSGSLRGVIPLQGRFTTFQDWNTPLKLRFRFEQSEEGTITVRGRLAGQPIWTSKPITGEDIAGTGNPNPDATGTFVLSGQWASKNLYIQDSGGLGTFFLYFNSTLSTYLIATILSDN